MADDDPFLTRTEAAALMRLNPRTLGNLAALRKGPPYVRTSTLRGRALYRRSAVLAFLDSNAAEVEAPQPAASAKKRKRKAAAT